MKEDAGIKSFLEKLVDYDLTPLERIIVSNESTVQTLLSVLFMVPIKVKVISQIEVSGVVVRWTHLVAEYSDENQIVVCLAESVIPVENNNTGFINGIREKNFGIGMLLEGAGIQTRREILGVYSDDHNFARTYRILGIDSPIDDRFHDNRADVLITEVFPKAVYAKLEGGRL